MFVHRTDAIVEIKAVGRAQLFVRSTGYPVISYDSLGAYCAGKARVRGRATNSRRRWSAFWKRRV